MSAEVLPSRSAEPVERPAFTRVLLRGFVLVALYVISGRLGLALAYEQDNATLFWPPLRPASRRLRATSPGPAPAAMPRGRPLPGSARPARR